jgi:hypothetical protein
VHFDGPRGMVGCPSISLAQALPMPHRDNAARRQHIPKMSFKVQNWPAYEAGLRQWQADIVDRGRSAGRLADLWPGRVGSLHRRSHPDEPDVAHCVQTAVAAD